MALYFDLTAARPGDVDVLVSPLAELSALLHVLAEGSHHPEAGAWTEPLASSFPAGLFDRLRLFSPLWARYRCRLFYPLGSRPAVSLAGELDLLAAMDLGDFLTLAAAGILGSGLGGLNGMTGNDLLTQPETRDPFALRCGRRALSRGELARELGRDPAAFRAGLLAFLRECDQAFFGQWWSAHHQQIELSARRLEKDLVDRNLVDVVAEISPAACRVGGTSRVRFDKLHRIDVTVGERRLILVPSLRSWPHLIAKTEVPWPAVMQYVVEDAAGSPLSQTGLHDRLAALASPSNVEICRHLASEAITTSELAEKLGRSMPEISRSLANLRAVDLVVSERDGRYIHHRLNFETVMRLGRDFLATVTR